METSTLVDRRALLARVNRRLKQRGEWMFRTRGTTAPEARWFIVNLRENTVVHSKDDLISCAIRLGAIAPDEVAL